MIKETCLHKEWIIERCSHFKKGRKQSSPQLIEKVIYALYLLENLSKQDIKFTFKGGTCLLLLLKKVHRFSIDIDIITEMDANQLESKLENIIENNLIFTKFEKNERSNSTHIPKSHYKLFYKSELYEDSERNEYILLDVLHEKNNYSELINTTIECEFIENEGETINVTTPSIDCILGDKLTAFAPNTTGIQYKKMKELEIIKQLFDISNLFDECSDIKIIKNTFIKVANNELKYRKLNITYREVLNDIFNTSMILAGRGSSEFSKDNFKELEKGVKTIKSFIFSKNFIIEDAVLCASKAAYLASLLNNDISKIERFDKSIDMSEIIIEHQPYRKCFKKIKNFNEEAYYYLYKAIEIQNSCNLEVAYDKEA